MLEKWDKHMPKTNNSMHSLLHILEITEVRPKTRKVFPCGSAGKESGCNVGDLGLIPGLGRSLEKVKASHCSILAWRIPWTIGIAKSQT